MLKSEILNDQICERLELYNVAIQLTLYQIHMFSSYGGEAYTVVRHLKQELKRYKERQELIWQLIAPLRSEYSQQ